MEKFKCICNHLFPLRLYSALYPLLSSIPYLCTSSCKNLKNHPPTYTVLQDEVRLVDDPVGREDGQLPGVPHLHGGKQGDVGGHQQVDVDVHVHVCLTQRLQDKGRHLVVVGANSEPPDPLDFAIVELMRQRMQLRILNDVLIDVTHVYYMCELHYIATP